MKIVKHTVSRDDSVYEAWPDLALTRSGKLLCVFSECTHHGDRSYTRIMLTESVDRGVTWSPKRPLTEGTADREYFYNNARLAVMPDDRIAITVDRIYGKSETKNESRIIIYYSHDEGRSWSEGVETPARGIVPDKLLRLKSGRYLLACHHTEPESEKLVQRLWYSDDECKSWQGPVIVGKDQGLNLCEASIIEVGDSLVALMRENSFIGLPSYKTISQDNGLTWSAPIPFPLPCCHRPTSGYLQNGQIMITHRFLQGGYIKWGSAQNLFASFTDDASILAQTYREAFTRIMPLDFDNSPESDTGYSGWVQFPDGEIYIVNYIIDDAVKAYIRGYSLRLDGQAEIVDTAPESKVANQ